MAAKKSWLEKLADDKGLPKVAIIDERLSKRWGSPREVDSIMRQVPEGKVITINESLHSGESKSKTLS
jgi:hypothetical protein